MKRQRIFQEVRNLAKTSKNNVIISVMLCLQLAMYRSFEQVPVCQVTLGCWFLAWPLAYWRKGQTRIQEIRSGNQLWGACAWVFHAWPTMTQLKSYLDNCLHFWDSSAQYQLKSLEVRSVWFVNDSIIYCANLETLQLRRDILVCSWSIIYRLWGIIFSGADCSVLLQRTTKWRLAMNSHTVG